MVSLLHCRFSISPTSVDISAGSAAYLVLRQKPHPPGSEPMVTMSPQTVVAALVHLTGQGGNRRRSSLRSESLPPAPRCCSSPTFSFPRVSVTAGTRPKCPESSITYKPMGLCLYPMKEVSCIWGP